MDLPAMVQDVYLCDVLFLTKYTHTILMKMEETCQQILNDYHIISDIKVDLYVCVHACGVCVCVFPELLD